MTSTADDISPRDVLHHLLSLHTPESTQLNTHIPQQDNHPTWNHRTFRKIGFGQCGLVFTVPDQPNTVVKVARPFFTTSLHADHTAHTLLATVIANRPLPNANPNPNQTPSLHAQVPAVYTLFPKSHEWWSPSRIASFPPSLSSFPLPSTALFTEHIPPLPLPIRNAIITLYCPPASQPSVRSDPANEDCLARVYLGRSRRSGAPKAANFGLRNWNLHLDQMVELGLPVVRYAEAMGEALAEIHWGARVDGFDVEFVLGGRRGEKGEEGGLLGAEMWVLDFNLCTAWDGEVVLREGLGEVLVEQLVHGFFGNDPYYPRPRRDAEGEGGVEEEMWRAFGRVYRERTKELMAGTEMGEKHGRLPDIFLEACVRKQEEMPEGVDKISTDPV